MANVRPNHMSSVETVNSLKTGPPATSRRKASTQRPRLHHPTHRLALRNMRIHGLGWLTSPLVQLISALRNTRSGCGINAVKRPSAVVTAVRPSGLPLGLAG